MPSTQTNSGKHDTTYFPQGAQQGDNDETHKECHPYTRVQNPIHTSQ